MIFHVLESILFMVKRILFLIVCCPLSNDVVLFLLFTLFLIVELLRCCWFFFKKCLFSGALCLFTCCRSPPHCCSPVKWSTEYSDQPSESAPIHCIERTLKHRDIPNGLRFLSSQYVLTLLQANVKFISSHCIFIIWSKE